LVEAERAIAAIERQRAQVNHRQAKPGAASAITPDDAEPVVGRALVVLLEENAQLRGLLSHYRTSLSKASPIQSNATSSSAPLRSATRTSHPGKWVVQRSTTDKSLLFL
jgi:hypothetical protein